MNPRILLPLVAFNRGRAITYEQLLFYDNRAREAGKEPTIQIRLSHIAKYTETSAKSVARYLQWLCERKFILIERVWRGSACILFIRVLIRPTLAFISAQMSRCVTGVSRRVSRYTSANTSRNTSAKTEAAGAAQNPSGKVGGILPGKVAHPPSPPSRSESRMKPSVEDAEDRAKAVRALAKEKRSTGPLKPYDAALLWNEQLREWGDSPFAVSGKEANKTLPAVRRTLDALGSPDAKTFAARLDTALTKWYSLRKTEGSIESKFRAMPGHPWVLNRHATLVFGS